MLLMGDFETTTKADDCRVWASCLVDIETNKTIHLANNLDDTFNYIKILLKFTNVTIYYHNLKFDGEFWLHYLLSQGFTYESKLDQKNCFNTLITDTGAFYQLVFKVFVLFVRLKMSVECNYIDTPTRKQGIVCNKR